MSDVFDRIKEDLAIVDDLWKKSSILIECLSYVEEEDDEEGEVVEVDRLCRLSTGYVDGYGAVMYFDEMMKIAVDRLYDDKLAALEMYSVLLDDLGGMVEFIEANNHKYGFEGCSSEGAVRFLNDMIFFFERVKGNLRVIVCR